MRFAPQPQYGSYPPQYEYHGYGYPMQPYPPPPPGKCQDLEVYIRVQLMFQLITPTLIHHLLHTNLPKADRKSTRYKISLLLLLDHFRSNPTQAHRQVLCRTCLLGRLRLAVFKAEVSRRRRDRSCLGRRDSIHSDRSCFVVLKGVIFPYTCSLALSQSLQDKQLGMAL